MTIKLMILQIILILIFIYFENFIANLNIKLLI